MSLETHTTVALSADDLAALRQADSVALHYSEGEYYLRAHKRRDHIVDGEREKPVWSVREQRVFDTIWLDDNSWRARKIATDGRIENYGEGEVVSAYGSVSSSKFSPEWVTIASLLREGDRLVLRFVAANNSETLREAGLFNDEVSLHVTRGEGSKAKRLAFRVDSRICPNNSARMVQVRGA